jgi:hypothetical protein
MGEYEQEYIIFMGVYEQEYIVITYSGDLRRTDHGRGDESERSSRPRRPPYNPVDARVTARANRRAGETGDWPVFN